MFDPRHPTLRKRLERGDALGVFWLSLGSVSLCELAARARPDAIVIDMQHGLWDRRTLEDAMGVVPSDIPVLARVAENSRAAIGEALDAGAEGVIVPLVECAEQARAAVALAHYPPRGSRSGGGVRPLADFVEYYKAAESAIFVCVMIETENGARNARQIAAVEGVDMVFIGTGDLALSLGAFPHIDKRHEAACAAILEACQAEETLCGAFTTHVDAAQAKRAQGYRMVVTANDGDIVTSGFLDAARRFEGSDQTIETSPKRSRK